jgi:hypothetical protein
MRILRPAQVFGAAPRLARLSEARRALYLEGQNSLAENHLILHPTSLRPPTNGVCLKLTSNVVDLTINSPVKLAF